MDFENFSQCIQYIQSGKPGLTTDKFLPAATGLIGTLLGFGLNYWTTSRKDAKTVKGKMICCEEDIDQIQRSATLVVQELCNLCSILVAHERLHCSKVPHHIGSLYLSNLFNEVAHKYCSVQRESAQETLGILEKLNSSLPSLNPNEPTSPFVYSKTLANLIHIAGAAWQSCEDFKNSVTTTIEIPDIIKKLDLTPKQLESYTAIRENIEQKNIPLDLKTTT